MRAQEDVCADRRFKTLLVACFLFMSFILVVVVVSCVSAGSGFLTALLPPRFFVKCCWVAKRLAALGSRSRETYRPKRC